MLQANSAIKKKQYYLRFGSTSCIVGDPTIVDEQGGIIISSQGHSAYQYPSECGRGTEKRYGRKGTTLSLVALLLPPLCCCCCVSGSVLVLVMNSQQDIDALGQQLYSAAM